MPFIVDPLAAVRESWAFDGLELNDGDIFQIEPGGDILPAPKRVDLISSADADGQIPAEPPHVDALVMTFRIRVINGGGMDDALTKLRQLIAKLDECEQNIDGLPLVNTPQNSTSTFTFDVLIGELTGLPRDLSGSDTGWFLAKPVLTIKLTCKPFARGDEEGPIGTTTSSAPLLELVCDDVKGDVTADARLVVTDAANKERRYVEWGREWRYYDAGGPSPLLLDSEDLVTTGFAGVQATRAGGYRRVGATHDTIEATLLTVPMALCGTGAQPHIGTFRVKARIWATSPDEYWRLSYQEGDGPFRAGAWVQPIVAGGYSIVDLGLITINPVTLGTQRWIGRIEAYSTKPGGETAGIDYLRLGPAEAAGHARANYTDEPGIVIAHDEFTGTTAGDPLDGRAAPSGGTWDTSGSATDFEFSDHGFGTASEEVKRTTVSDSGFRFGIVGPSSAADVEAGVMGLIVFQGAIGGVVARWSDVNNFLAALITADVIDQRNDRLELQAYIGGVQTISVSVLTSLTAQSPYAIRLVCYASGRIIAVAFDASGAAVGQIDQLVPALPPAGQAGIVDYNPLASANTRYYENFYVATPPVEQIACFADQSIEFSSDDTLRANAAGTVYGRPKIRRGARFFLPPAGDKGRSTRVAVAAFRNDIETAADVPLGDSLTAEVFYTPRYRIVGQP